MHKTATDTYTYLCISNLDFSEDKHREDVLRLHGYPQVVTGHELLFLGPILETFDLRRENVNVMRSRKYAAFEC